MGEALIVEFAIEGSAFGIGFTFLVQGSGFGISLPAGGSGFKLCFGLRKGQVRNETPGHAS